MTLPLPLIIINFKTYERGSDVHAERLAQLCERVALRHSAGVAIACQAADAFRLSRITNLPLLAQHVDPQDYGKHTGSILMETLQSNGCVGSIINHSECRVPFSHIKAVVEKARRIGFMTVACARTSAEARRISHLKPDFVAVEPPQFIASAISVSTAKPGLISLSAKAVGTRSMLLAGAGIRAEGDVRVSLRLGAKGVILSSQILATPYPGKALDTLLKGTQGEHVKEPAPSS